MVVVFLGILDVFRSCEVDFFRGNRILVGLVFEEGFQDFIYRFKGEIGQWDLVKWRV